MIRGDWGSLGHGVQWDSPYIGNSNKDYQINVMETLHLSASWQEGIFTAVNLVRKSYFFELTCNFLPFFVISTVFNCFVQPMSFKY